MSNVYLFYQNNRRFERIANMKRHHKLIHTKQESLKCPVCSIPLVNSIAQNRHLRKVHPTFDDYFCKLCSAKFYSARRLSMHTKKIHCDETAVCEICNLRFEASSGLNLHMVKAHNIKLKKFEKKTNTKEPIGMTSDILQSFF